MSSWRALQHPRHRDRIQDGDIQQRGKHPAWEDGNQRKKLKSGQLIAQHIFELIGKTSGGKQSVLAKLKERAQTGLEVVRKTYDEELQNTDREFQGESFDAYALFPHQAECVEHVLKGLSETGEGRVTEEHLDQLLSKGKIFPEEMFNINGRAHQSKRTQISCYDEGSDIVMPNMGAVKVATGGGKTVISGVINMFPIKWFNLPPEDKTVVEEDIVKYFLYPKFPSTVHRRAVVSCSSGALDEHRYMYDGYLPGWRAGKLRMTSDEVERMRTERELLRTRDAHGNERMMLRSEMEQFLHPNAVNLIRAVPALTKKVRTRYNFQNVNMARASRPGGRMIDVPADPKAYFDFVFPDDDTEDKDIREVSLYYLLSQHTCFYKEKHKCDDGGFRQATFETLRYQRAAIVIFSLHGAYKHVASAYCHSCDALPCRGVTSKDDTLHKQGPIVPPEEFAICIHDEPWLAMSTQDITKNMTDLEHVSNGSKTSQNSGKKKRCAAFEFAACKLALETTATGSQTRMYCDYPYAKLAQRGFVPRVQVVPLSTYMVGDVARKNKQDEETAIMRSLLCLDFVLDLQKKYHVPLCAICATHSIELASTIKMKIDAFRRKHPFLPGVHVRVEVLHSQLKDEDKEDIMKRFRRHCLDMLIVFNMGTEGISNPFLKVVMIDRYVKGERTKDDYYTQLQGRGRRTPATVLQKLVTWSDQNILWKQLTDEEDRRKAGWDDANPPRIQFTVAQARTFFEKQFVSYIIPDEVMAATEIMNFFGEKGQGWQLVCRSKQAPAPIISVEDACSEVRDTVIPADIQKQQSAESEPEIEAALAGQEILDVSRTGDAETSMIIEEHSAPDYGTAPSSGLHGDETEMDTFSKQCERARDTIPLPAINTSDADTDAGARMDVGGSSSMESRCFAAESRHISSNNASDESLCVSNSTIDHEQGPLHSIAQVMVQSVEEKAAEDLGRPLELDPKTQLEHLLRQRRWEMKPVDLNCHSLYYSILDQDDQIDVMLEPTIEGVKRLRKGVAEYLQGRETSSLPDGPTWGDLWKRQEEQLPPQLRTPNLEWRQLCRMIEQDRCGDDLTLHAISKHLARAIHVYTVRDGELDIVPYNQEAAPARSALTIASFISTKPERESEEPLRGQSHDEVQFCAITQTDCEASANMPVQSTVPSDATEDGVHQAGQAGKRKSTNRIEEAVERHKKQNQSKKRRVNLGALFGHQKQREQVKHTDFAKEEAKKEQERLKRAKENFDKELKAAKTDQSNKEKTMLKEQWSQIFSDSSPLRQCCPGVQNIVHCRKGESSALVLGAGQRGKPMIPSVKRQHPLAKLDEYDKACKSGLFALNTSAVKVAYHQDQPKDEKGEPKPGLLVHQVIERCISGQNGEKEERVLIPITGKRGKDEDEMVLEVYVEFSYDKSVCDLCRKGGSAQGGMATCHFREDQFKGDQNCQLVETADDDMEITYTNSGKRKERRRVISANSGGLREYQSYTGREELLVSEETLAPAVLFDAESGVQLPKDSIVVVKMTYAETMPAFCAFTFTLIRVVEQSTEQPEKEDQTIQGVEMYRSCVSHGIHELFFQMTNLGHPPPPCDYRYHDASVLQTKNYNENFCIAFHGVIIRVSSFGETVWHGCRLLGEFHKREMKIEASKSQRHPSIGSKAFIAKGCQTYWKAVKDVEGEHVFLEGESSHWPLHRVFAFHPDDPPARKAAETVTGILEDVLPYDEHSEKISVPMDEILAPTAHSAKQAATEKGVRLNKQDTTAIDTKFTQWGVDYKRDPQAYHWSHLAGRGTTPDARP